MKISFCINGTPWTAEAVEASAKELYTGGASFTLGTTWETKKQIFVAVQGGKEAMEKIFAHELCHAVIGEYDLHGNREAFTEEEVCNLFGAHHEVFSEVIAQWREEAGKDVHLQGL